MREFPVFGRRLIGIRWTTGIIRDCGYPDHRIPTAFSFRRHGISLGGIGLLGSECGVIGGLAVTNDDPAPQSFTISNDDLAPVHAADTTTLHNWHSFLRRFVTVDGRVIDYRHALPAWVNVENGKLAPYRAPSGVATLSAYVTGTDAARPARRLMVADVDHYYSASLIMLTDMARRETAATI